MSVPKLKQYRLAAHAFHRVQPDDRRRHLRKSLATIKQSGQDAWLAIAATPLQGSALNDSGITSLPTSPHIRPAAHRLMPVALRGV